MLKKSLLILSLMFASLTANAGVIESVIPTDFDGVNDDTGFSTRLTVDFENLWGAADNTFGLYFLDTSTNTVQSDVLTIFGAGDLTAADSYNGESNVLWDFANQTATASLTGDSFGWAGITNDWLLGAFFTDGDETFYSHVVLGGDVTITDISANSINDLEFSFKNGHLNKATVRVSDMAPWGENTPFVVTEVPEPAMAGLFALGVAGLAVRRRKSARVTSA